MNLEDLLLVVELLLIAVSIPVLLFKRGSSYGRHVIVAVAWATFATIKFITVVSDSEIHEWWVPWWDATYILLWLGFMFISYRGWRKYQNARKKTTEAEVS